MRADWYITPPLNPNQDCQIFFYVPNGNATANLTVGLFTPVGDKAYQFSNNFSEAPVSGPQRIWPIEPPVYANIAQVNIGDNNGEAYPKLIGWGAADSVEVKCS